MSVVTVSREFGSEGSFIAKRVAQKSGYHFVGKDVIGKVLIQYGFVEFKHGYDSLPGFWASFDSRRAEMVDMLNRVMQALAHYGNVVILGRGSFAVLGGFADVLNVRLQAPLPTRIKRVMEHEHIVDFEQAEAMVKENDRVRATFIKKFYNVRWDTAGAFDVVLDTGKVLPEAVIPWLVDAVKGLDETKTGGERTTQLIQVDHVLASVISEVLEEQVALAV